MDKSSPPRKTKKFDVTEEKKSNSNEKEYN